MNKILEIKFGSHLYGTNTENSDLDLKGIYLPTAREIVLGTYKPTISTTRPKQPFERNKKDDVDIEIFSLDRFLQLLAQGQVVALDVLFGFSVHDTTLTGNAIMQLTYINRDKLLSKNLNAFTGYAKQQAAKYGVKGFRVAALRDTLDWLNQIPEQNARLLYCYTEAFVERANNEHIKITSCKGPNDSLEPHLEVCNRKLPFHCTVKHAKQVFGKIFEQYGSRALLAEQNEGIDWKALSHAVRVNSEAKELLLTGFITFPRPDRELLLKIKTGQMNYKEVAEIIEQGLAELLECEKRSALREKPDQEWIDNFVYDVYKEIVCQR